MEVLQLLNIFYLLENSLLRSYTVRGKFDLTSKVTRLARRS